MMRFAKLLVFVVILIVPALAMAVVENANPAGNDAWDLWAMGNGKALVQILTAIKLMLVPEGPGTPPIRYLMLFLAVIGFVVLAVQAGFDPGKHLVRMFAFVFVVLAVVVTSSNMRADVTVIDPVNNFDSTVTGVPAIVALPATIISGIGRWLRVSVETNFSLPNLTLTDTGRYNLFAKLMSDSDKYVITNPNLKRAVSAYVADCVVPGLARGKLTVRELVDAPNMVEVLAKANSAGLLTRYYPADGKNTCGGELQGQMGALVSCAAAWQCVSADLDTHAQELFVGSANAWGTTGTLVPFETAMSAALAQAAGGGASPNAGYSRPQGFILQKAMLGSMTGAFRDAAVQTGNNELMTATAIAQAEQQQRSTWWTASELFKNMMGYVYTTLQAFIFAIVPIIVIALMVPGLGKSILVNYGQILIWLALWEPMLAIINFLITVFGAGDMANVWNSAGGVTMRNSATITEQSNNMVIAAQFLGTMVPLIAWGLVKGSMAFTEFITAGVGSQFAGAAGAQAATGNVSMGNMSMSNVGMNKFDTAASSTVGDQETRTFMGASANTLGTALGGGGMTMNAASATSGVGSGVTVASKASKGTSHGEMGGASTTWGEGERAENRVGAERARRSARDSLREHMASIGASAQETANAMTAFDKGTKASEDARMTAANAKQVSVGADAGTSVKGGGGGGGGSKSAAAAGLQKVVGALIPRVGVNASGDLQTTNQVTGSAARDRSSSSKSSASSSVQGGQNASTGTGQRDSGAISRALAHAESYGRAVETAIQHGASITLANGTTLSATEEAVKSDSTSANFPQAMTLGSPDYTGRSDPKAIATRADALGDDVKATIAEGARNIAAEQTRLQAGHEKMMESVDKTQKEIAKTIANTDLNAIAPDPTKAAQAFIANAEGKAKDELANLGANHARQDERVIGQIKEGEDTVASANPLRFATPNADGGVRNGETPAAVEAAAVVTAGSVVLGAVTSFAEGLTAARAAMSFAPAAGSAAGAGLLGTTAMAAVVGYGAYQGTSWVMENTEGGKAFDNWLASNVTDPLMNSITGNNVNVAPFQPAAR